MMWLTLKQVKYCVATITTPHCKVEFSQTIIIVIMTFNVVKMLIMLYLVFLPETPLVTVGDAISSFMANSDPATRNMCLYGKADLKRTTPQQPMAKQYHAKKPFRFAATTLGRLLTFGVALVADFPHFCPFLD